MFIISPIVGLGNVKENVVSVESRSVLLQALLLNYIVYVDNINRETIYLRVFVAGTFSLLVVSI